MDDEKLKKASEEVWRELNFLLHRSGLLGIDCYVTVIISLFDRAFYAFAKGDNTEMIKLYEKLLKLLNGYVDFQKEKIELQREG